MKKIVFLLLVLILVCFLSSAEKEVRLTSLEWPPYSGQQLDQQGASIVVAKAAFMAMGYDLQVDFYPWARAVNLAKSNPKYDGYFPEYFDSSIENNFIFSNPIGTGPLGFAERKADPVNWSNLNDLKKHPIATVRGYVNTAEFDAMAENGEINVDPAVDDLTNLKKLSKKRVDLVVIDKFVMDYLLNTEAELKSSKGQLQFNKKLLEDKKLFICFKKGAKGESLSKIFNKGLEKINVEALMQDYFKMINK
jgi:polar amino acid transport system substrate-binding protein